MSGYLSRGAVKPLVATGALTRTARRRLSETGKYVRDPATSGELGRLSDGVKTTVRVRARWNGAAIRRGRALIESELATGLGGRAPSYEPEPSA